MQHSYFMTLSDEDRVSLTLRARRFAASLALRYAASPDEAYDLYLAGLNALPGILARYRPGDTMGFLHAIDLPLRNAIVNAAVSFSSVQREPTPRDTLTRFLQTGHIM